MPGEYDDDDDDSPEALTGEAIGKGYVGGILDAQEREARRRAELEITVERLEGGFVIEFGEGGPIRCGGRKRVVTEAAELVAIVKAWAERDPS